MSDKFKLILIGVLSLIAVIIIVILVLNNRKNGIKKDINDLQVRFNAIKTVPLAFKLSKAQALAKRSDETKEKVDVYYQKYEEAQKHIDAITEMFNNVEDALAVRDYKETRAALLIVKENIEDSEKEVKDIDEFLEQFSKEESEQRDYSTTLKESFRDLKLYINDKASDLSIANEGLEKKIEEVEDLFSSSEEYMYINEFLKSEECLAKIKDEIVSLRRAVKLIPELIYDTKGVIPTLLDEVNRQYALDRQRGICTEQLGLDERLATIQKEVNEDVRNITLVNTEGIKERNEKHKEELNEILSVLNNETESFQNLRPQADKLNDVIAELKTLLNYVSVAYKQEKERFGVEDLKTVLEEDEKAINKLQADYITLSGDITDNSRPASEIKVTAEELLNKAGEVRKELANYKAIFDKNTETEARAKSQLMKLQVVLNEVEVKVLEYHMPTIASSYKDDLVEGRKRIAKIKELLEEVPLNLDELNKTLDEAIDFIYKFYNNVNNIVGMAIMVENAIVFGNKYRSSYPEVERDLSKAEFSYLNGEYTKALTMAISCMERLFPNSSNNYLEN